MQGRVHLGGALSGRDIEAVNKTVSGLTKLLFPDAEMEVSDEDLEWIVRVALESRRRVKEQQRRVFKSEFRNTHFSYLLGTDGVEQFVSTPELHSDEAIESDPLPPGQVWGVSLGTAETGPGLYRIEVTCGRGGGVKILNQPTPPAFRESVRVDVVLYLSDHRHPNILERCYYIVPFVLRSRRNRRSRSKLAKNDGDQLFEFSLIHQTLAHLLKRDLRHPFCELLGKVSFPATFSIVDNRSDFID